MEVTGVCPAGFPHSDICGSQPTCGSPQLFAAGRVLLRQMVPWHPPCALLCLISTPETILSFLSPVSASALCFLSILSDLFSASCFRFPSPSTGLPEKLISSSVCSCQGSGRLIASAPSGRTLKTIQRVSFFERQSVLFALSSTVISD